MSFKNVTSAQWIEFVTQRADKLSTRSITDIISRFQLVPGGLQREDIDASIHDGNLTINGDFIQLSDITVIDGDMLVSGKLSTQIEGGDGNATLVIFGNLECGSIDHDWASILIVTGNVIVREWVFGAREDSSIVIGGDFKTPIFIGADIWVSVGGSIEMEYGYGYAVEMAWSSDAYGAPQIHPKRGWQELALKLGLGTGRIRDEEQFMELIENRLRTTGALARSD